MVSTIFQPAKTLKCRAGKRLELPKGASTGIIAFDKNVLRKNGLLLPFGTERELIISWLNAYESAGYT
jgi:hypothetical protein